MDSNVHGGFTVPLNTLQLLYFIIISENRLLITVLMTMGENQDTEENLQALNMNKC
jgi:hypothetical protein